MSKQDARLVRCSLCDGTGRVSCPTCKRNGKVAIYDSSFFPKVTGYKACTRCNGGYITCHTCHGRGAKYR